MRFRSYGRFSRLAFVAAIIFYVCGPAGAEADPLRIGYSDWPGYTAWQVAIDKGWLKDAGLDVEFVWFDYSAEMDAFTANKLDAAQLTNGDTLTMAATGGKSVMIGMIDYSNGDDMVIGAPGITSIKELRGKKVGVEVGLVDHLLLDHALKANGMTEKDIQLVNSKTNELPQVLGSGVVAAIGVWQPVAGTAMAVNPGSRPIYTSATAPGLIYDTFDVTPASLAAHRVEYVKLLRVWDRVVHYIADPATQPEAVKILAKRVGVPPQQYARLIGGVHYYDLQSGIKVMTAKASDLTTLSGSNKVSDEFNLRNGVYKSAQTLQIDPSLTADVLAGK